MNRGNTQPEDNDHLWRFYYENTREIIFTCDAEGRFLDINHAVSLHLNFSPEDVRGLPLDIIIKGVNIREVFPASPGGLFSKNVFLADKSGGQINALLTCTSGPEEGTSLCILSSISRWDSEEKEEMIRRLNVAVEQSPAAIVITDRDGIVEYVNPGFVRVTGYQIYDVIGRNINILKSKEMPPSLYDELWSTIKGGKEWHGEVKNRKKTGELYWESVTISPIKNSHDEISHFMKVAENITEQKKMMDSLIRSYEFIEGVMESTNPIFVIDGDGNFLQVNRRFLDISGYASSQLIGRPASTVFSSTIMRQINGILMRLFEKDTAPVHFESDLVRKNGEMRTISIFFSLLRLADDEKYIVGTLEDITGRKEAEEQISKLSRAIEQSPASVLITDINGKIEYVNPKFTELTGYTDSEVLGKNTSILKSGLHNRDYYENLWQTVLNGMEWRGEFKNKKKNGELYWESASISPYRNQEGRVTHFVAVKEDITDRKRAEEALKNKNDAMEQELQYAQMIIKQILPASVPYFSGLSMEYRYRPLEAIGGDLFLYNEIDDDHLGVFLGDVTGHGVSAALFLALVKSSIDRISRQYGGQPVALLQKLNKELYASMASYFLTAIYGVFSRDSGAINFTFARGGHCPLILYRADEGSARLVSSSGKPIGIFDNITIEEAMVTLHPGDRIYLYTDGIYEVMNSRREMLGFEGLLDIILEKCSLPLHDSMDAIIRRVKEFQEGSVEEDDVVLMGFGCSKKSS